MLCYELDIEAILVVHLIRILLFDTYAKDALRNGIDSRCIFFSHRQLPTAEAEEEAEYVLNQISPI